MEQVDTSDYSIILKKGIVFVDYKTSVLSFEIADEMIKTRLKITREESFPVISDARLLKKWPRDSRERMAESDAGFGITCVAIIIQSSSQAVFWNFFNAIYKAPSPTKLFTDTYSALEWVEKQIKK